MIFKHQSPKDNTLPTKHAKNNNYRRAMFGVLFIAGIASIAWLKLSNPTTISSGVTGIVLLGPTCPVLRVPPDPKCADKPYATTLVLTTADQSRVITEFNSGADGKFSLMINPGEYAIRSVAEKLPYCGPAVFKVEANKFTDTTVSCDTGIR